MTSPLRSLFVVTAPLLMTVIGACGADPTPEDDSADRAQQEVPADSSTLLAQQKMYLSFEVTLKGERKFGEMVPADALADVAWRVNRSVKGEMVLDMPLPGSVPPSLASDTSVEMMEEGRYIGWMAALPDDPDFMEKMMTGELDVASNPTFVPVEFRIDDEVHHRSRDFPSEPFGTSHDQTIKGHGKAYISKDGIVSCDLKRKICDISGLLGGYTDGTDLVTITEISSYPGDQGKSRTMNPASMLPEIAEAPGDQLAGIKFELPGLITKSFSEPYHETYLALGADAEPVVTVSVTVSPKPALDTSKPQ
jgi:hypothetical protein